MQCHLRNEPFFELQPPPPSSRGGMRPSAAYLVVWLLKKRFPPCRVIDTLLGSSCCTKLSLQHRHSRIRDRCTQPFESSVQAFLLHAVARCSQAYYPLTQTSSDAQVVKCLHCNSSQCAGYGFQQHCQCTFSTSFDLNTLLTASSCSNTGR